MKAAFVCEDPGNILNAYSESLRAEMAEEFELLPEILTMKGSAEELRALGETEVIFSSWGMPCLGEVGRENLSLYWQPNQFLTFERNIENLTTVLPFISNVHVFAWEGCERLRLAEHRERWRRYLDILAAGGRSHALLLEFVPNDDPAVLPDEAAELKRLINGI